MKFELNNLFKLFKNDKIVTTFLLKFWDLSGAKVWESCRSRKSWKNEYLVAIVAVDTAENGPPKVWRNWINYSGVSLAARPDLAAALESEACAALEPFRLRLETAVAAECARSPAGRAFVKLSTRSPKDSARAFAKACPLARLKRTRSPPRSENQGLRRNYFNFFGNPLTPNSSKFEISPKFCEAFFNPVKFRQIFIKIWSKTREIDSKFAENDEIRWKKLQKYKRKIDKYLSVERCKGMRIL